MEHISADDKVENANADRAIALGILRSVYMMTLYHTHNQMYSDSTAVNELSTQLRKTEGDSDYKF